MSDVLWRPGAARAAAAEITRFRKAVAARWGADLPDYAALHRWSVAHRDRFWLALWEHCGVVSKRRAAPGRRMVSSMSAGV